METLSLALSIPLSFIALASGLVVGLRTGWGVLRYRWVTSKLVLLLGVIAVGALVVGARVGEALEASPGAEPVSVQWRIVGGAATAAVALVGATVLSRSTSPAADGGPVQTTLEGRLDERDDS